MEVTRTVTIKLTCEEVAEIIKDHLSQEGFIADTKSIEFDVPTVITGPQWDPYTVNKFKGCTVTCKLKTDRNNT